MGSWYHQITMKKEIKNLHHGDVLDLPSMMLVMNTKLVAERYATAFADMGRFLTKKAGLQGYKKYEFVVKPQIILMIKDK